MTALPTTDLIERLDRILPQTQCGQCGYDGCRPYAEAMARGEAGIAHVLATMRKEMEVALALTGVTDVAALDRNALLNQESPSR